MSVVIPQETKYASSEAPKPDYHLMRINQQSGGNTVVMQAAGTSQSTFEIPARVVNLSKSYLQFTLTAAAQAADFVALIESGCHAAIRDIELFTQSGLRLCNLSDVGKHNKVKMLTDTKLSDFLSRDSKSGFRSSNAVGGAEGNYALHVANDADPALANARTSNTKSYLEPTGYSTSGADNTAKAITFRFPLSDFKNSILAMDKDLYFDQILRLVITWRQSSHVGVDGDDAVLTNQGALGAVPTLTALYFYLAVEKNQEIAQQVQDLVKGSGLSLPIDYPYHYNNIQTGTSHSISYRFNRTHGHMLKRIYAVPYIQSSTAGTNFWNHARDQETEAVTDLYTQLDNEKIQQWTMDSTSQDEYLVMREKLKGSVIQDSAQFNLNYFYVDSWDNLKLWESEPEKMQGLPLDVERKWDLIATAEDSRGWYVSAVVQRMLHIKADGITLD